MTLRIAKAKNLIIEGACKVADINSFIGKQQYEYDVVLKRGQIQLSANKKVTPVLFFKDRARTPSNIASLITNAEKKIEVNTPVYFGTIVYVSTKDIGNNNPPATLSLFEESSDCVTVGRAQLAPTASEFTSKCADLLVANLPLNITMKGCSAGAVSDFRCDYVTNEELCDSKPDCFWSSSYGGSCNDCSSLARRDNCNLPHELCKCSLFTNGCFVSKTSEYGTYRCIECITSERQAPECKDLTVRSDCLSGACGRSTTCKWERGVCKNG